MANENLAVIPDDWGDYAGNIIYDGDPQICFLDFNVVRTSGKPSVRLEPHTPNDPNVAREVDGKWYPTKPGDRWVAKCWIKTDNSTPVENADPYHGGRIGLDLYGPKGDGTITILDGYPHGGQEHKDSMVMWNTPNWTLKTWDITVPSTIYTKDVMGNTIPPTQVTQFVLWMQAMQVNDGTAIGNAWFADAELYINPEIAPSGCFIATACGTSNIHLSTLRRFRDKCLPIGLVNAYYRGSPPLAHRIRTHENVKTVFRKVIEWLTCQLKKNLTL